MYLKIANFIVKISGIIYPEFYERFKNYIIDDAERIDLEIELSEDAKQRILKEFKEY